MHYPIKNYKIFYTVGSSQLTGFAALKPSRCSPHS